MTPEPQPTRLLRAALACGFAVLLASCGQGAAERPAGAPLPPRTATAHAAAALDSGSTCAGANVHERHINQFACETCHPKGGSFGFDVAYTFPRGTTTAGGTIVPGAPTSCTVACHFPLGAPAHAVTWNTPGPLACTACHETTALPPAHPPVAANLTRAECQACHITNSHMSGTVALAGHDSAWMTQSSPSFHALAAERGLVTCQGCHAQDLGGGAAGVACAQCHDQGDPTRPPVSWTTNCLMCHGGFDNPTSAPPKAIWGYGNDPVRVGAHTSHVTASPISPAFACNQCHVRPIDVFTPGHIDVLTDPSAVPLATVTFGGVSRLGGAAPTWDRPSATCASTYCHGSTLAGGSNTTPVWTKLDGSQAACGTCHGVPPPSPHPTVDVSGGLAACNPCHSATVDATGAIIAPASGGKHLDGTLEASGHPAAWMDTASSGFHAYSANLGLGACESCHGQDLSGGSSGVSCGSCHDRNLPQGVASWARNCVMCHGGTDNQTGAPPRATWGQAADPIRVGAHTIHLTDNAIAKAFDCGVCHVKPADAFAEGHLSTTTASVTFAGIAVSGSVQPAWNRASATCSNTYCHGSFANGNMTYAPTWTAPAANVCGTCHGLPPGGTHPGNPSCGSCHDGYTATTVNAALHLNGAVDVRSLTCTSCHGDGARQPTTQNPQLAAAPPIDTLGNSTPSSPGVGAHQLHLQPGPAGNAIACTECHVVPTSVTHSNDTLDIAFGPLATANGTLAPTWDGTSLTCSSTYCHGRFHGGNASYAPAWTSPNPNPCGTCHGAPPPASTGHPQTASCGGCHAGYTSTTVNPATHLDGRVQISASGCFGCHGDSNRVPVAGADPNAKASPPITATGAPAGAHLAHVNTLGTAAPLACAECHAGAVPDGTTQHPTGTIVVAFGARARTGGTQPSYSGATGCAATYCHGAYQGNFTIDGWWGTRSAQYAGAYATPRWTDGPATCTSCHGAPPASGQWHTDHPGGSNCDLCHPDVNGAGTAITDPALHVNGVVDVKAGECANCH